jgi:predicted naringenin-chalcone synthase
MYPDTETPPDEVIHVSTTGYLLPSPVHELVSRKGWQQTTVSHCYHQGCYGAFPAVRMAAGSLAAARSGLTRQRGRVDVAHTEICSIHVSPECVDAEHIICDSLFGDGFIRYSAFPAEDFGARGDAGLELVRWADTTIPASLDAMSWRPIANRFEMTLSPEVPRLISAHIGEFMGTLLRDAGLDQPAEKAKIIWVIHPGGPAIVEFVGHCLGLSKDQITGGKDALREGGNTSSATVARIWHRILADTTVPKGTPVVSMAFGPGLTATALVSRVV